MSIRLIVLRGFGNGVFNGDIANIVTRGYTIGAAVVPDADVGAGGGYYTDQREERYKKKKKRRRAIRKALKLAFEGDKPVKELIEAVAQKAPVKKTKKGPKIDVVAVAYREADDEIEAAQAFYADLQRQLDETERAMVMAQLERALFDIQERVILVQEQQLEDDAIAILLLTAY